MLCHRREHRLLDACVCRQSKVIIPACRITLALLEAALTFHLFHWLRSVREGMRRRQAAAAARGGRDTYVLKSVSSWKRSPRGRPSHASRSPEGAAAEFSHALRVLAEISTCPKHTLS